MVNEMTNCGEMFGPQGPQGVQGLQGIQGPYGQDGGPGSVGPMGLQGIPGIAGLTGPIGIQGPVGAPGPQGLQGLQGIPGIGAISGIPKAAYLSIYSLTNQTLASLASPFLESVSSNSGDFDASLASASGVVRVLVHGFYLLNWTVDGHLTAPFPTPIPGWSFGIYLNGALIPGSLSGSYSVSADQLSVNNSGSVIVELKVGDLIKLVNTSSNSVDIVSVLSGSLFPAASATLNLSLVQLLP